MVGVEAERRSCAAARRRGRRTRRRSIGCACRSPSRSVARQRNFAASGRCGQRFARRQQRIDVDAVVRLACLRIHSLSPFVGWLVANQTAPLSRTRRWTRRVKQRGICGAAESKKTTLAQTLATSPQRPRCAGTDTRRTEIDMARYDNILGTDRQHADREAAEARAAGRQPVRQDRGVQPDGLGQGPPGARRHRGRRASGELRPGQTVIEATSGNTGIGLAMVCAQKGYPLVVTMAENFSVERRKLMRFLGAKVVLTPASEKGSGMLAKADRAGRDARLVPVPPVRERSECRRALAHDGAGDPRATSPASGSTTGSPGFGTGGTLRASRAC